MNYIYTHLWLKDIKTLQYTPDNFTIELKMNI